MIGRIRATQPFDAIGPEALPCGHLGQHPLSAACLPSLREPDSQTDGGGQQHPVLAERRAEGEDEHVPKGPDRRTPATPATRAPGPLPAGCRWPKAQAAGHPRPLPSNSRRARGAHAPRRAWASRCSQRSTLPARPSHPSHSRNPGTRPAPCGVPVAPRKVRADGQRRKPQAIPDLSPRTPAGLAAHTPGVGVHRTPTPPGRAWASRCRQRSTSPARPSRPSHRLIPYPMARS
jgi:hypothetical protein